MCCSSMSEWWYEPSWSVNCGPNLIWWIAKGFAQIVSDVLVDVLEDIVNADCLTLVRMHNHLSQTLALNLVTKHKQTHNSVELVAKVFIILFIEQPDWNRPFLPKAKMCPAMVEWGFPLCVYYPPTLGSQSESYLLSHWWQLSFTIIRNLILSTF